MPDCQIKRTIEALAYYLHSKAKHNIKEVKWTESKCAYVQMKLLEYVSKLMIKILSEFKYQIHWFQMIIKIHDKNMKMWLWQ